ncbi:MAG: hypothetical protein CM15mP29_2030 [Alphaproteobacteria bacterium]|nr:MAG: hypothetical protein CM15mP29_2030 [Alphaproteobacteria bacterium]
MIKTNMQKTLNDLKWQIEAGIDEVISDEPIVFSNEKILRKIKK